VAALLGLALAVFGAWFAFILGPKGTAAFHATSNAPLVLGPNVLNRVTAPVTVTASAASGPVFLGAAVPQDTDELVGQAKHNFVAGRLVRRRRHRGPQHLVPPSAGGARRRAHRHGVCRWMALAELADDA
jgi:hypothetical protein